MGAIDYGTQIKSIGFFDPAKSGVVNKRNMNVQERGIYKGGWLTVASTTSASLSPLVCIINGDGGIGDGGPFQLRVETTVAYVVTGFTPTNKYVVLRWAYTGDQSTDYMDVLLLSSIQIDPVYDIIVGVGVFSGADLVGINYADTTYPRTEPHVSQLVGKVEATEVAEGIPMYIRVHGFNANYGTTNLKVYTHTPQTSPYFPIPTVTNLGKERVDVIYLDTDGIIKRIAGTEANIGSAVAPAYQNKVVLAEITIPYATSIITQSMIRDVRPLAIGGSTTVSGSQLTGLSGITAGAGVIPAANLPTGPWLTIPTLTGNALKYLRVNAAGTAIEFMPPTYS